MAIYKYEDGSIGTAYEKNFDGEYPSLEEVVEYIENADTWDCVDHGVYRELCDEVGLDCDDYDDPEALMEDVRISLYIINNCTDEDILDVVKEYE